MLYRKQRPPMPKILQHEGKLGCIKAEAYADLLIVDGTL